MTHKPKTIMNDNDEDKDIINLAIGRLRKKIQQIIEKRSYNNSDGKIPSKSSWLKIQNLLRHTQHILQELYKRRKTLSAFLEWFQQEWNRISSSSVLVEDPLNILIHAFTQFLRCQDGLVLLTSGECRHDYDLQEAKTTKYTSRLSTLQQRNDGYTLLYSGIAYSGFGWDEFFNEQVGVKSLLIAELQKWGRKKPIWEYLEQHGATEMIENLFDKHESETNVIKQQLQSLKSKIINDITQKLKPKSLKFATQDKMERLSLFRQNQQIDLQRRADSFQILGPVLPLDKQNVQDWKFLSLNLMENKKQKVVIPDKTTAIRKRRRIVDSSDSEDDENPKSSSIDGSANNHLKSKRTNDKGTGLVVRVKTSRDKLEESEDLNEIKTQMGVKSHELEQARESFERESQIGAEKYCIEEEKVKRLQIILRTVLSRDVQDEDEIWDARECLRLAHMEAGNYHLWETSNGYDKALDHFNEAKKLVEEQIKCHEQISKRRASNYLESQFIRRNLIYLKGQACVNIGISLFEASRQQTYGSRKKAFIAISELEAVRILTSKLREMGSTEENGPFSVDYAADCLKADQLNSLGCRWLGQTLWLTSQEEKAVKMFECASSLLVEQNLEWWNMGLDEEVLDLAAECIYATCSLADLAGSKMEQVDHKSIEKGDHMFEICKRALGRHCEILKLVQQNDSEDRIKQFRMENGILSIEEIRRICDDTKKWWAEMKEKLKRYPDSTQSRKEIQRDNPNRSQNIIIFPESPFSHTYYPSSTRSNNQSRTTFRGRKNQYRHNHRTSDTVHSLVTDATSSEGFAADSFQRPIKYRPWGDDLFAEQTNQVGQTLVLPYPSSAPPIPEEYKHCTRPDSSLDDLADQ